jgi:hypothetical protein
MRNLLRGLMVTSLLVAGLGLSAAHFSEAQAAEKTNAANKAATKIIRGGIKGTTTGTVNLTTSDCKLLLGGTVVQVSDGRCGASGAYCKSSAGSACITE